MSEKNLIGAKVSLTGWIRRIDSPGFYSVSLDKDVAVQVLAECPKIGDRVVLTNSDSISAFGKTGEIVSVNPQNDVFMVHFLDCPPFCAICIDLRPATSEEIAVYEKAKIVKEDEKLALELQLIANKMSSKKIFELIPALVRAAIEKDALAKKIDKEENTSAEVKKQDVATKKDDDIASNISKQDDLAAKNDECASNVTAKKE